VKCCLHPNRGRPATSAQLGSAVRWNEVVVRSQMGLWRYLIVLYVLYGLKIELEAFCSPHTNCQSGSAMKRWFALEDSLSGLTSSLSESKFHNNLHRKMQHMREISAGSRDNGDGCDGTTRLLGQHMTLLIDGDNVRGKTGFRLTKDDMIEYLERYLNFYRCEGRDDGSGKVCLDMILFFDHGTEEQAFHLHLKDNNKDKEVDLCVVFAGSYYKADDIITRDASWFADIERLHDYLPSFALPPCTTIQQQEDDSMEADSYVVNHSVITVTQDRGLRRRVRPKNSSRRLTKKQRKARDQLLKQEAEKAKTQKITVNTDISVISSHLLADMLIDIHKHRTEKDDQEQVLDKSVYIKEYQAMRSLLKREVEITEKTDSIHRRLKRSTGREMIAKLKVDVGKLRTELDNIRSEYHLLLATVEGHDDNDNAVMEEDMVHRGCALLRKSMESIPSSSDTSLYQDEETWERILFAEELRRKLIGQRSAKVEGHGEDKRIQLYVTNVNINANNCEE
jgi:hypothetical protein